MKLQKLSDENKIIFSALIGLVLLFTVAFGLTMNGVNFAGKFDLFPASYKLNVPPMKGSEMPPVKDNVPVTRAELAKLIGDAKGINPKDYVGKCSFDDVPKGSWFEGYVCYLVDQGAVDPNQNFKPGNTVSKVEGAKLYQIVFIQNHLPPLPSGNDPACEYSDVAAGAWYHDAVNQACHYLIIQPKLSKFLPTASLTKLVAKYWIKNALNSKFLQ